MSAVARDKAFVVGHKKTKKSIPRISKKRLAAAKANAARYRSRTVGN